MSETRIDNEENFQVEEMRQGPLWGILVNAAASVVISIDHAEEVAMAVFEEAFPGGRPGLYSIDALKRRTIEMAHVLLDHTPIEQRHPYLRQSISLEEERRQQILFKLIKWIQIAAVDRQIFMYATDVIELAEQLADENDGCEFISFELVMRKRIEEALEERFIAEIVERHRPFFTRIGWFGEEERKSFN